MTPDEERRLLEERDLLRREVESLTQQVKLVVRAEHGLTRSRRLIDRQLQRIRRLGELALGITGALGLPEILEQARGALLDFFELDEAVVVRFEAKEPSPPGALNPAGPGVVDADTAEAERMLACLVERGAGPRPGASPRVLVWVPLRSRANEPVALLVAWTSRVHAHHRDLPRAEHLPFLELFGGHVTRALDNATLTAELRQKNQELSASFDDLERAQAQLVQAQKLEALGRLAGGIAHDFNNILTLIVGAADSLRAVVQGNPEAQEDLDTIAGATKRATAITRRLLAFGRQQEHRRESVDLNALTIDLSQMLRRLIGDDVTLKLDLDTGIPLVGADPVQLEQIILNLVLNARDAMPGGGTLTLQTRAARTSDQPGLAVGAVGMVTLRVIDTGTGIDESVRRQLFEPFFTTKPVGKGTGLGLATVYGLVDQNQGLISVHSTPGHGAAFAVTLPVAQAKTKLEASPSWSSPRGTILLAEDEEGIWRLTSRLLRRAGFEVHEARDGLHALEVAAELKRLDLVVTDVVMPGLSGPELVRRLRATRAALPVVFMSGHTFDSLDAGELDPEKDCFLAKPFAPEAMKGAVEKLMLAAVSSAGRETA
jgi:signal transduction histidine kinase/CheY-like chemotaxis protein